MTREQAKKWFSEITAFAAGKTIQIRSDPKLTWVDCLCPSFENENISFRVKPEPKLRAWNSGDDILWKKVQRKDNHDIQTIITARENIVVLVSGKSYHGYDSLLEYWEQLDGSPCGVMEVE